MYLTLAMFAIIFVMLHLTHSNNNAHIYTCIHTYECLYDYFYAAFKRELMIMPASTSRAVHRQVLQIIGELQFFMAVDRLCELISMLNYLVA